MRVLSAVSAERLRSFDSDAHFTFPDGIISSILTAFISARLWNCRTADCTRHTAISTFDIFREGDRPGDPINHSVRYLSGCKVDGSVRDDRPAIQQKSGIERRA